MSREAQATPFLCVIFLTAFPVYSQLFHNQSIVFVKVYLPITGAQRSGLWSGLGCEDVRFFKGGYSI